MTLSHSVEAKGWFEWVHDTLERVMLDAGWKTLVVIEVQFEVEDEI